VREIAVLPGVSDFAALAMMIPARGLCIAAPPGAADPSAEELAEMAALAAIHSSASTSSPKSRLCQLYFGSFDTSSSRTMRSANAILKLNSRKSTGR